MSYNNLDRVTLGQRVISTNHTYIHDGKLFEAQIIGTVPTATVTYIGLTTPATKYVHYIPESIKTTADKVSFKIFESQSFTGGTSIQINNHNRVNNVASGCILKSGVIATATGTAIHSVFLGGATGVGQSTTGDDHNSENEWVLKRNTTYLFEVTNGSTASNTVSMIFSWYEEDSA